MEHTLALIERSHQGDKEARDTIFKENAGLIYSVAKRFLEEAWTWKIFSRSEVLVC